MSTGYSSAFNNLSYQDTLNIIYGLQTQLKYAIEKSSWLTLKSPKVAFESLLTIFYEGFRRCLRSKQNEEVKMLTVIKYMLKYVLNKEKIEYDETALDAATNGDCWYNNKPFSVGEVISLFWKTRETSYTRRMSLRKRNKRACMATLSGVLQVLIVPTYNCFEASQWGNILSAFILLFFEIFLHTSETFMKDASVDLSKLTLDNYDDELFQKYKKPRHRFPNEFYADVQRLHSGNAEDSFNLSEEDMMTLTRKHQISAARVMGYCRKYVSRLRREHKKKLQNDC